MSDKVSFEIKLHCLAAPEDIKKLKGLKGVSTMISRMLKGYNVEIHPEAEIDSLEINGILFEWK